MTTLATSIVGSIEAQGVNSLIAGFSFASALAWYGVVQAIIEKYVKTGPGISAHVIAALFTTLLSILVFMVMKKFWTGVEVKEPGQPVFAITR